MRVIEFSEAHSFLEHAREFLFADEGAHNLILSSALALSKGQSRSTTRSLKFLACTEGKKVQGAALRTPQDRWILSPAAPEILKPLLETIPSSEPRPSAIRNLMLPSLSSPATPEAPASLNLHLKGQLNFMSLTKLEAYAASAGLMRVAAPKDLKLLITWSQASAKESDIEESPKEASEIVQKYLEHRQLFVWEDEGRIKAMAAIGGFTPNSTRISQVYTDPKARGRGYATSLVHRLTHRQLAEAAVPKRAACVLMADAANPITKHVYEKLGYKTLFTYDELRPGSASAVESASGTGSNVTTTG